MTFEIVKQVNSKFKIISPSTERWLANEINALIEEGKTKYGYEIRRGEPQISSESKILFKLKRFVINQTVWDALTDEVKASDPMLFDLFCLRIGKIKTHNLSIQRQSKTLLTASKYTSRKLKQAVIYGFEPECCLSCSNKIGQMFNLLDIPNIDYEDCTSLECSLRVKFK